MSDTNNSPINRIIAPSLSGTDYASKLAGVFSDINNNFVQLANHDFIKGDAGDEVQIISTDFTEKPTGSNKTYAELLKECINAKYTTTELATINYTTNQGSDVVLDVFDNFDAYTEEGGFTNRGKLQIIYNITGINKARNAVSSLYYVFLDGRFANNTIGRIAAAEFQNVVDTSCIMVYDSKAYRDDDGNYIPGFKILENAFPTIYYESGNGLCWKINGNFTGIPVQGIPGVNGLDTKLFIVKSTNNGTTTTTDSTTYESTEIVVDDNTDTESPSTDLISGSSTNLSFNITHIYDGVEGYKSVTEYIDSDTNDIEIGHLYTALIFCPKYNDNTGVYNFYFGSIIRPESASDTVIAYCDSKNSIDITVQNEAVVNALKSIDLKTANSNYNKLPGLFIPIEPVNEEDSSQKVHLIAATSITNEEGRNLLNTDIVFTPIDDINTLELNSSNADNKLHVDKYLYLSINTNYDTFNNARLRAQIFTDGTIKYNGILKYKLTSVVNNIDTLNTILNGEGSNSFGTDLFNSTKFVYNEVAYRYKDNSGNDTISLEHISTMPIDFKNNLTNRFKGIYQWELCNIKDSFDIADLKNAENSGNNYSFPEALKYIFTTDLTPSNTSKFMWFDGYKFLDSIYFNYITKADANRPLTGLTAEDFPKLYYTVGDKNYPIIQGWSDDNLFIFKNYIPIYNNSYFIQEDTALNFNYNINITGDGEINNKSLTVHGAVNSNNLNVHGVADISEIDKIYTTNTINGENGISLCKDSFKVLDEFNKVNDNEKGLENGTVITPAVNTNSVITDSANVSNLIITGDAEFYANCENKQLKLTGTDTASIINSDLPLIVNKDVIMVSNDINTAANIVQIVNSGTTTSIEQIKTKLLDLKSNSSVQRKISTDYKGYTSPLSTYNWLCKADYRGADHLKATVTFDASGSNFNDLCIATVEIENPLAIVDKTTLTLKFLKRFCNNIYCKGKCSNGNRPVFKNAHIILSVYAKNNNTKRYVELLSNADTSYKYTYNTLNGARWYGYDENGNSHGDNVSMYDRYVHCYLYLKDINITYNDTVKSYISDDKLKKLKLYICVKEASVEFTAENDRDVIDSVAISKPRPQDISNSSKSLYAVNSKTGIKKNFTTIGSSTNYINIASTVNESTSKKNIKLTTIDENGVNIGYYDNTVYTTNSPYIIYLGPSLNAGNTAQPCIGIYDYSTITGTSPNPSNTEILLTDIYNVVNHIKNLGDAWEKFGV